MKKLLLALFLFALIGSAAFAAPTWNFYGGGDLGYFAAAQPLVQNKPDQVFTGMSDTYAGFTIKLSPKSSTLLEYDFVLKDIKRFSTTFDMGGIQVTTGKDYTPWNIIYTGNNFMKTAACNLGYGGINSQYVIGSVAEGSRFFMQAGLSDLKIAIVPSSIGISNLAPKVELGYNTVIANINFDAAAFYDHKGGIDNSFAQVATWGLAGGAKTTLMNFTVGGTVYTTDAKTIGLNGSSLGVVLVGGYQIADSMKIEAGYGSLSVDKNTPAASQFYVQLPIQMDQYTTIIPEIGSLYKDNYYYGVKTSLKF